MFLNFQNCACCKKKYLKDNNTKPSFGAKICSHKKSRKTVRFLDKIMSVDKYPSIILSQM